MTCIELVFISVKSEKIIENWSFNINNTPNENECGNENFSNQVAAILRQIQNSVAFLPVISNEICKFDILVHCDRATKTSKIWEGTAPGVIPFDHQTDALRTITSSVSRRKILHIKT